MVLATSVDRNAPTTFRIAAISTAVRGRSAPVATEVAIALALSWKPLVKSKTSAVSTTSPTTNSVVVMHVSSVAGTAILSNGDTWWAVGVTGLQRVKLGGLRRAETGEDRCGDNPVDRLKT